MKKYPNTTGTEWRVQQEWRPFHIYNDKNEGGFLWEANIPVPPKKLSFLVFIKDCNWCL